MKFPGRAVLLSLTVLSLAALPGVRAADFPHQGSDLPVDPAVRWGKLDNGLRYALLPNKEPKGRASLRLAIATGALNETDAQRGLAHFLEHMSFNGSKNYPPGTLIEFFQRLGMSFGGDTNASTGFDRTTYMLELPDTKPERFKEAFTYFADVAGGLLLLKDEIDKERGIILSEKRARDSVEFRQFIGEFGFLLPEARFINRIPIGTEEVVSKAPRGQFVQYYDTWYRPDLMYVIAVGDFDVDMVETQLRALLSPLAARAPAQPAAPLGRIDQPAKAMAKLLTEMEAPAVQLSIQTITPFAHEPDTAANRLKYLPRSLALQILNRRFSVLAKKEGAPFLSASASGSESFDFFRNASVDVTCKPEQWQAALAVGEQELRRALQHGFQVPELQEVVAAMRNGLEQAVRTAPTRRSEQLASGLAGDLIDNEVFTHPSADLALFGPALDKVTVDDCLAALRQLWDEGASRRLWVTGNLQLGADAEQQILAAFTASQAVPVTAPAKIEEAVFGYTNFGPAGTVATRKEIADLGISLLEFKNGVRLNLKVTDFEAGRIRVSVRVGGGRLSEPAQKNGLAFYAGNVFGLGGLGKHSVDDLRRILAGKTVADQFAIGNDAFSFSGATNRADLALQLQLLCARLTDPGFRPEAARLFEKGVEVFYKRLETTVQGPMQAEVPRLLANGDPRFGVPPKAAVTAFRLEDARNWLKAEFAQAPIEIGIVGDFEPDAAIAAVAATFGTLPARAAKPDYAAERRAAFPAAKLSQEFHVPTEIPKGEVRLYWQATDGRHAPLARRLSMLSSVLEDRLRKKIREEMGDTYSPDAGASLSDTYPGYGFMVASATVDPAKARIVADAIKAAAADLFAQGVSEDELVRAKQPALTSIRQSARTNPYWLGSVLGSVQEQPERIDWARSRESDTTAITAAELSALAKQYLDPAKVHEFYSLPAAPAGKP